jgi:hypothetical protein
MQVLAVEPHETQARPIALHELTDGATQFPAAEQHPDGHEVESHTHTALTQRWPPAQAGIHPGAPPAEPPAIPPDAPPAEPPPDPPDPPAVPPAVVPPPAPPPDAPPAIPPDVPPEVPPADPPDAPPANPPEAPPPPPTVPPPPVWEPTVPMQNPSEHVAPKPHVEHDAPPRPQKLSRSPETHCPSRQQPLVHVLGVHMVAGLPVQPETAANERQSAAMTRSGWLSDIMFAEPQRGRRVQENAAIASTGEGPRHQSALVQARGSAQ